MSSMFITSQLHRDWKEAVKARAREALSLLSDPVRVAPSPSASEPPSEEFGETVRAVLPFLTRGLNHTTFSAIVSAVTASQGADPLHFLPYQYMGGSLVSDQFLLTWPRDSVGLPLVYIEDFPSLAAWPTSDDVPVSIAPFPPDARGVVLTGYDYIMLSPQSTLSTDAMSEEELSFIHARELSRTEGPKTFLRSFYSNFRYTGCVRLATDAEIDTLFASSILPEHWLKTERLNFRDFFTLSGIDSNLVELACNNTERMNRGTPSQPSSLTATDVPPATRYPRRTGAGRGSHSIPDDPAPSMYFTSSRQTGRPTANQAMPANITLSAASPSTRPRPLRASATTISIPWTEEASSDE